MKTQGLMTGLFTLGSTLMVFAGLSVLAYKPGPDKDRTCENCQRPAQQHCDICYACPTEDCDEKIHALREATAFAS